MVKLVVGNLPPSATNQCLKEIFYEYSDLQDYKLISNYGFVYLESEQSASHAVQNLNGAEYRGFQITVNYASDNANKRKFPTPANQFQKPAPVQNRLAQPLMEQRNSNPYNLPYSNADNGMSRTYNAQVEKRYGPQPPLLEKQNANPYKTQGQNPTIGLSKPFDFARARSYGAHTSDPRYGSMAYSNMFEAPQEDPYGSYDYSEQYIPEEDYFANVPPVKRTRIDPFMDNEAYGYGYNSTDFAEDDSRYPSFKGPQPNWFDYQQMNPRTSFLHPRDEPFYYPRSRRVYQSHKSYIDEYEDDRDYSVVDPYPAYLKQYRK